MTIAFVSYTLRDHVFSPGDLYNVADQLKQLGYEPFVDLIHNNSKHPQEHILEVLGDAALVILCRSPAVLSSVWVRWELAMAWRKQLPICGMTPLGHGSHISPALTFGVLDRTNTGDAALAHASSLRKHPIPIDRPSGRGTLETPVLTRTHVEASTPDRP
jgi:hypothetical protein